MLVFHGCCDHKARSEKCGKFSKPFRRLEAEREVFIHMNLAPLDRPPATSMRCTKFSASATPTTTPRSSWTRTRPRVTTRRVRTLIKNEGFFSFFENVFHALSYLQWSRASKWARPSC